MKSTKLNKREDIDLIGNLRRQRYPLKVIGDFFGVSEAWICQICIDHGFYPDYSLKSFQHKVVDKADSGAL